MGLLMPEFEGELGRVFEEQGVTISPKVNAPAHCCQKRADEQPIAVAEVICSPEIHVPDTQCAKRDRAGQPRGIAGEARQRKTSTDLAVDEVLHGPPTEVCATV
jgi:hypothetical protein